MKKWFGFLPALLLASLCFAAQPVDINTANAEQLAEALNGVGKTKAELIVRYREMHGDFKHADELVNVRGIGLATVDKNRENIRIGRGDMPKAGGQ